MYAYEFRMTNEHYLVVQPTDKKVIIQAEADDEAHKKAQQLLDSQFVYSHGVLQSEGGGRISMKDKPGFADYEVFEHYNRQPVHLTDIEELME